MQYRRISKNNFEKISTRYTQIEKYDIYNKFTNRQFIQIIDKDGNIYMLSQIKLSENSNISGVLLFHGKKGMISFANFVQNMTYKIPLIECNLDNVILITSSNQLSKEEELVLNSVEQDLNLKFRHYSKDQDYRIINSNDYSVLNIVADILETLFSNKEIIINKELEEKKPITVLLDKQNMIHLHKFSSTSVNVIPDFNPNFDDFFSDIDKHTTNKTAVFYTKYLPFAVSNKKAVNRPFTLFYQEPGQVSFDTLFSTESNEYFIEVCKTTLFDMFNKYGIPEKLEVNDFTLYEELHTTFAALNIELLYTINLFDFDVYYSTLIELANNYLKEKNYKDLTKIPKKDFDVLLKTVSEVSKVSLLLYENLKQGNFDKESLSTLIEDINDSIGDNGFSIETIENTNDFLENSDRIQIDLKEMFERSKQHSDDEQDDFDHNEENHNNIVS